MLITGAVRSIYSQSLKDNYSPACQPSIPTHTRTHAPSSRPAHPLVPVPHKFTPGTRSAAGRCMIDLGTGRSSPHSSITRGRTCCYSLCRETLGKSSCSWHSAVSDSGPQDQDQKRLRRVTSRGLAWDGRTGWTLTSPTPLPTLCHCSAAATTATAPRTNTTNTFAPSRPSFDYFTRSDLA